MEKIQTTDNWQGPATLITDEIWQCNEGEIELATGSDTVAKGAGLRLLGHRLDAIHLAAGTQVQFRTYFGHGCIIRMPV